MPHTLKGKHPSFFKNSKRAPALCRAVIKSPIGRRSICCDERTINCPFERARRAVIKRAAVPALPTYTSPLSFGSLPPQPCTVTVVPLTSTPMPRLLRQPIKVRQSSERPAPYSTDVPSARAEMRRARAVMLFEPGTETKALLFFILLKMQGTEKFIFLFHKPR